MFCLNTELKKQTIEYYATSCGMFAQVLRFSFASHATQMITFHAMHIRRLQSQREVNKLKKKNLRKALELP